MVARLGAKWGWYNRWKGGGEYNAVSDWRGILEGHVRSLGAFEAQPGRCQKNVREGRGHPGQTCVCSSTHEVYKLSLSLEKRYERRVRGETYLDFRMVWGNAISNKPVWCP
jgi:hypothetical protein